MKTELYDSKKVLQISEAIYKYKVRLELNTTSNNEEGQYN